MYDYSKIDRRVETIIKKVISYMTYLDKESIKEEIQKAYIYARDAHEWQFRLSWAPYIVHPVEATNILLDLKPDIHTIQACLLHDVIEDTPKTSEDINDTFWSEVSFICEWMEKVSKVKYRWEDRNVWSLRKMFIAMAEDLRVVFIKLSDRLHNMRTLKYHPKPEKRTRIAEETLNIYAPIADRLGLFALKNYLEEECFKILDIKEYRKIKKELRELSKSSESFIKNAEKEIENLLSSSWIKWYEIDYRVKSVYSIYNKMQKKWLQSVKWLHDIYWIRIILKDEADCYRVLWLVHNKWKPIPKKFKDYIALPKPNWYKSLHTTIMWLLKDYIKQPTEIQIKTYKMKEYSDIWVAAHFEYKEKWSKIAKDVYWVKELKELTESLENTDFMSSLKVDVFKNRIFVFTPKWDSINLPAWSTPIDFAYYVHTDLWNHISIAKVNNRVYPLDKELHNWDVVDIIIDKNKKPNPFWLSFVKTTKAKNRIKSCLRKEDLEEYIERWKEILNKYLAKEGLPELDSKLSILKHIDDRVNNYASRVAILERIWNFSITPANVIKLILKNFPSSWLINKWKTEKTIDNELKTKKRKNIVVWWEENVPYVLCHCCRRKIPDKIVAHINSKWKLTVHRRTCDILKWVNKERLLSAYIKWTENDLMIVKINLLIENKIWMLKEISDIIFAMWINVDQISSHKEDYSKTRVLLDLEIPDYDFLIVNRLVERIKFTLDENLLEYKVDKIL